MKHMKITIFCFFLLSFTFHSTGFASISGRQYSISGKTMGTFYNIKFISKKKQSVSLWKTKVNIRLKEVNKRLSMFDPKSEISLFNQNNTGETIAVSLDFYSILVTAKKLHSLTDGAWDGTIKPLVDLWGFGVKKATRKIPESHKITLALSKTGFNHIKIKGLHTVYKTNAVSLDLGSIAKGYGVDAIAHLFTSYGIRNVLVEIGGELYASGKNRKGKYWAVGISKPDKSYINQDLYKIISLNNLAIATSGNYRNFFEINGKTYSHIIDPKTGFPVENQIVSASVIAKDCTFADGLATALMVMDIEKGISLVDSLANTECMIIQKKGKDLISHTSKHFNDFVVR